MVAILVFLIICTILLALLLYMCATHITLELKFYKQILDKFTVKDTKENSPSKEEDNVDKDKDKDKDKEFISAFDFAKQILDGEVDIENELRK